MGRGAIAYPDFARDVNMDKKKVCITVSYCTTLMRAKGNEFGQYAAGCVPRDPVYAKAAPGNSEKDAKRRPPRCQRSDMISSASIKDGDDEALAHSTRPLLAVRALCRCGSPGVTIASERSASSMASAANKFLGVAVARAAPAGDVRRSSPRNSRGGTTFRRSSSRATACRFAP